MRGGWGRVGGFLRVGTGADGVRGRAAGIAAANASERWPLFYNVEMQRVLRGRQGPADLSGYDGSIREKVHEDRKKYHGSACHLPK